MTMLRTLLRRSASDTREVARSGVVTASSAATGAFASFLLLIVVARGTTVDTAGLFFQCIALTTAAALVTSLGAAASLTRETARLRRHEGTDASREIWAVVIPVGLASVAFGVAGTAGAPWIARLLTDPAHVAELTGMVHVMLPAVPFLALTQLLAGLCRGVDDPVAGALFDLAGQPLLRVAVAVIVVAGGGGPAWLGLVVTVPAVISTAGLVVRARHSLRDAGIDCSPTPVWDRSVATSFWRFSAPRGLEEIVQASSIWLLTLVVGAIGTAAQAATYAAITRFVMGTTLVLQSLTTAMLPRLASAFFRHEHGEAARLFHVTTRWIVLGSMPICLSLLLFPATLMSIVSPHLPDATTGLRVLAVASLVNVLTGPVGGVVLMAGRSWVTLMAATLGVIAMLVPAVPLIEAYGATGAAVAWSASLVTQNVALWLYSRLALRLSPWSRSSAAKAGGGSLLIAVPVLGALLVFGDSWAGLLSGGILSTGVAAGLLRPHASDLASPS